MSVEFYQTGTGARFYEQTMPELVRQLGRVAGALETMDLRLARIEARLEALDPHTSLTGDGLPGRPLTEVLFPSGPPAGSGRTPEAPFDP